jgi:hypothetical protein
MADLTAQQKTEVAAYYQGRNSWELGEKIPTVNPHNGTSLARHWATGLRDVLAEERLSADMEWDNAS